MERGIIKAVSGILESCHTEPYITYAALAEDAIWQGFEMNEKAQKTRQSLIEATKLNIINRKEYPFFLLQRRLMLPTTESIFCREKMKYIEEFARLCGLAKES